MKKWLLLLLTLLLFAVSSCDMTLATLVSGYAPPVFVLDESGSQNIGEDLEYTAGTGSEIIIDASKSYDPDKQPFVISWELTVPGGSSSALDTTTGKVVSFTPDIAGTYTVTATLSNYNMGSEQTISGDIQ